MLTWLPTRWPWLMSPWTAVPSYLGMVLTAAITPGPVVLIMPPTPWRAVPRASLRLTFPDGAATAQHAGSGAGAPHVTVTLYAANAGAFVDLAADLAYTYSQPLSGIALDEHLPDPSPTQPVLKGPRVTADALTVAELSAINKAIGVLIAGGSSPEQADAVLTDNAATAGITLAAAATAVLAGSTR